MEHIGSVVMRFVNNNIGGGIRFTLPPDPRRPMTTKELTVIEGGHIESKGEPH
jgi:hypothetical protein